MELIIGPMFSGKTTELIRRVQRHKFGGKKVIIGKYSKDTRYNEEAEILTTHSLGTMEAVPIG